MASRKAKIGPTIVDRMQPGDVVWDTELHRFGVRRRNASTTYVVKARIDGRQRWLALGRHGPVTAAEARAKARQVLGQIDSGQDPTRERESSRTIPHFDDFAKKWLREHVGIKRKPNTAREYRRVVERHLNPALGKVRIDRITRSDALTIHAELVSQPYVANRVIAVLSAVMTFAEKLGHRQPYSNPCRGIERFKEHKRKRPLNKTELAALWSHLESLDAVANPYVIAAFRLLLLTGMRREEVLTLEWARVDLDGGVLHLAEAKTGPRDVILSGKAVEVLRAIPRVDGNPYVLPGQKHGQRLINISDHWQAFRTVLGFPDARIHDLRHTVASVLARSAPLIVVRDALGHAEITTTNGYSHAANDDVRTAVDRLALTIAGR